MTSTHGQLNPDWVEWLMCWPIGWTDIDTPNFRLVWLHPSYDPAASDSILPFIPRVTSRRQYRAPRIKAIGNGQYPPTAYVMAEWGFTLLEILNAADAA